MSTTSPLPRFLSRYFLFDDAQPDFVPSDALSLGLLAAGQGGLQDFYRRAYLATCRGLNLPNPEWTLTWFTEGTTYSDAAREALPRGMALPFEQLARLRRAMVEYCDEWGSVIEGDLWGQRKEDATDADLRARLGEVKRWYWGSRQQLLAGLALFDPPLLTMLGWQTQASVPYAALLRDFDFPSSDEVLP